MLNYAEIYMLDETGNSKRPRLILISSKGLCNFIDNTSHSKVVLNIRIFNRYVHNH